MAFELEDIERAALEDLHAAASDELRRDLRIEGATAGAGFVSVVGTLPASAVVANRTIGLALAGPETKDTVDAVLARYRKAGVARYFIHVHPDAQAAELGDWLTGMGLEPARGWVKFTRGRAAPPERPTTLEIRRAVASDAEAFGRIVADAFDLGPAGAPWLGRLIGRPGWHIYMSFDGDRPAGAGTMFVRDGIAWLDWGATAPAARGRGSQSAILRQRILNALDLGCHLLATTTGEEVPGDPQHSYNNIVRLGFEPSYVRKNYAPPKIA